MEYKLYANIAYALNNYKISLEERHLLVHAKNMLDNGANAQKVLNNLIQSLNLHIEKHGSLSPNMQQLSTVLTAAV